MYKVDISKKKLIRIPTTSYTELHLKERFDIQEWIADSPEILGESLLIISKELVLPSGRRLDLLAVDQQGALVIIELKRDHSGSDTEWQAIKYASYCSSFSNEEIYGYYTKFLGTNGDDAQNKIESFIVDNELEKLNERQRIILVSKEFHSEVISAVLWLRESNIDIKCIRLTPYTDQGELFISPDIIIPLPEAKDYIQKKERKQIEQKQPGRSTFSLEKSNFEKAELKTRIIDSLTRPGDLTPRLRTFFEIINREDRDYNREEVRQGLYEAGIGNDIGQAGRYLSNISQFLTKKSNPHLRQIVEFKSGGPFGETKDNYHVISEYRDLLQEALRETDDNPLHNE